MSTQSSFSLATQTSVAILLLTVTSTHFASAQTHSPVLEKIGASTLDEAALVLGEPARGRTNFGQNINGAAFQDAITSFGGWQYAAHYNGARRLCLSRRRLPQGAWQTLHFSDYEFKTNDAHNIVSLGISPRDGSIHLAYDGHGIAPTYFRSSRTGVATQPEKVEWNEQLFKAQTDGIQAGIALKSITYPRFFTSPDGDLQLSYRTAGSGIGELWFVDYNAQNGSWENTRQIDSRAGAWKDEWGASPTRSSYHNAHQYSPDGKLHTTWTWRENNPVGNRDIAYAYSEDKGFTWKNNAGQIIARSTPNQKLQTIVNPRLLGHYSPGVVVVPISRKHGMINQQAQAIDSRNRVHIVASHVTPQSVGAAGFSWPSPATWGAPAALRYHHYLRESDGNWKHIELPQIAGGRGWLGFDARDNAYFVHLDRPRPVSKLNVSEIYFTAPLVVAMATAQANYADWKVVYQEAGPFLSEFRGDEARLKNEGVLSIFSQRAAPAGVFSSTLSVIDLKLKP